MMTIGEFALCTGLSVKALRFYDERGLLTPADVDPYSGYRRYSASQLRTATTIRILRTAGLGVEDVRTALDEPDRLDELLRNHAADTARRRGLEDRAMELGREVIASTLNSVTATIDSRGRVTNATQEFTADHTIATVPIRDNVNASVYVAPVLSWAALCVTFVAVGAAAVLSRRQPR